MRYLKLVMLILAGSLTSATAAADDLVIKFVAFEGARCAYRTAEGWLFIDRVSSINGQTQIPWAKLEPKEFIRKRLNISESELPAASSPTELVLRFYALHDSTHADHYEADTRLTKELLADIRALGGHQRRRLKTSATYHAEQGRDCELVLDLDVLR